jgi:hypothetical protein
VHPHAMQWREKSLPQPVRGKKVFPVQAMKADRGSRGRGQLKCDSTRAETRFRLSAKRTSPFKSARASVQSPTGSRGVPISGSNASYTMFPGSVNEYWLPTPFASFPYSLQLNSFLTSTLHGSRPENEHLSPSPRPTRTKQAHYTKRTATLDTNERRIEQPL